MRKSKNTNKIQFDPSKTSIILFDQKNNFPFDNSYKPTVPTQDDITNIDSLINALVTDYDNSLDKGHKEWSIDFKKYDYKRQLIVVTNNKNEKVVWLNYFFQTSDNSKWKTTIIHVKDGGNCYFNFKINLTTKKIYDLFVNGEA